MYISKEEAKKMIDEAPGEMLWVDKFNRISYIHTRPEKIKKEDGVRMVCKADNINCENNEIFTLLSMTGIQELMVHNIRFANENGFQNFGYKSSLLNS